MVAHSRIPSDPVGTAHDVDRVPCEGKTYKTASMFSWGCGFIMGVLDSRPLLTPKLLRWHRALLRVETGRPMLDSASRSSRSPLSMQAGHTRNSPLIKHYRMSNASDKNAAIDLVIEASVGIPRAALLAIAIMASCLGVRSSGQDNRSRFRDFVDAAQFLPTDAESYLFQSVTKAEGSVFEAMFVDPAWKQATPFRLAVAGSAFRRPGVGDCVDVGYFVGQFTGVMVIDFGPGREEAFRAWSREWYGTASADGHAISDARAADIRGDISLGYWPVSCIIDDRFLVAASSGPQLERALERIGSLEGILAEFPPLDACSSDALYAVCRRKPADSGLEANRFEVQDHVVLEVHATPGPWTLYYRSPSPPMYHEVFRWFGTDAVRTASPVAGWIQSRLPNGLGASRLDPNAWGEGARDSFLMRHYLFGIMWTF